MLKHRVLCTADKYFAPFRLNAATFGNNTLMREPGQDINVAKERAKRLLGVSALVKMKGPRGKIETSLGHVSALFPAVFTITFADGTTKTFPYADILTGNVLFLQPTKS